MRTGQRVGVAVALVALLGACGSGGDDDDQAAADQPAERTTTTADPTDEWCADFMAVYTRFEGPTDPAVLDELEAVAVVGMTLDAPEIWDPAGAIVEQLTWADKIAAGEDVPPPDPAEYSNALVQLGIECDPAFDDPG